MDRQKKPSGKKEPKSKPSIHKSSTKKVPKEPEVKEFTEIGGSPVPGLTLRYVLHGHTDYINRIAWSPDGNYLASTSQDSTIRIWDVKLEKCIKILNNHKCNICSIAWSPDGEKLAVALEKGIIRLWFLENYPLYKDIKGHTNDVLDIIWVSEGEKIISNSGDFMIRLWDLKTNHQDAEIKVDGHYSMSLSPDGNIVASTSSGCDVQILTKSLENVTRLKGHTDQVISVAWSPKGSFLASGSFDNTIRLWERNNWKLIRTLEGHTAKISNVSFSADEKILASKSYDQSIRLWRTDTWETIATLYDVSNNSWHSGQAFHPTSSILATSGDESTTIRIWDVNYDLLIHNASLTTKSVHYTTAKLVLVGDSGVGKTGLGWRLAHGEFKEHASTHGQQFWSIPQLGFKRKDGTDCEAVLWDLAGQHVYRQVHSIFLENVAAALVLFDPSNRQDPLKGAQFWLEQLKEKGNLPPTMLVGARVDRGAPALSQADLDQFCQRYGITGGYLSTSAMSGEGMEALLEKLKAQIPWEEMTATVTTVTFKRIKDYVLTLKEKTDRKGVLVSPKELRNLLETSNEIELSEVWEFTNAEMMTAVGHLETHGYVSILHNSAGEQYILLTPDLLVNIAASIMLLADKNPKELGSISETELLKGNITFDELKGLEKAEQQILLDAAILRFLEHNICFRDTFGEDTLLIFPSLIKQKRPLQQDEAPATDDISYVVRGRVENLYASLVVLLGYTPTFSRINQWQNQAQYVMREGEICGFRLIEDQEGEIELVLYYGDEMKKNGREKFQELFEKFLYQRDVEVTRFPSAVCPKGHSIERTTFINRIRDGQKFVFCYTCDDKVALPVMNKEQNIGIGASPWLQREEAMARLRSSYEKHLTNIKSYRRGWAAPRCYISYLPEQSEWAKKLIHDLQDAGVYIIEKTEDIKAEDFAIMLDTPSYKKAYKALSPALGNDPKLIQARLASGNKKIISLACEGTIVEHNLIHCTPGKFCDETHYSLSLFNLVLELYTIPLNHKGFEPLRQKLHEKWESTLAGKSIKMNDMTALKIFISYSHKDETIKDELVIMLAGLHRRGIVDAWHDRRIEAGDEWYKSIQDAMDDCDLALLLVSPNYLASRFIQEDEQPKLLKRREEMKTRVMPIIIRPCVWQSEEAISILQVMPKDGKAVIKFSKNNGDRDQVWADIASEIEKRAKAKLKS